MAIESSITKMSQAALSGGQSLGEGGLLLGGGEGSQVSHPLYETLTLHSPAHVKGSHYTHLLR